MKENMVVSARLTKTEEEKFEDIKVFFNKKLERAGLSGAVTSKSDVIKCLINSFHDENIAGFDYLEYTSGGSTNGK